MTLELQQQITIGWGLDFISRHFPPTIWPRTLSTRTTEGRQVLVYSKEEAFAMFKQASLLDCKISAYPHFVEWKGLNRQAPDIIFIDLDLDRFKSKLFIYSPLLYRSTDTMMITKPVAKSFAGTFNF